MEEKGIIQRLLQILYITSCVQSLVRIRFEDIEFIENKVNRNNQDLYNLDQYITPQHCREHVNDEFFKVNLI
jgi:hypothetical protein